MTLTKKDNKVLMERMQQGGHHIIPNDQTRHLVVQKLLIHYVYNERFRQLDAIAVCRFCINKLLFSVE